MKNLIFINRTVGVGKTEIGIELHKLLPKAVYLDGDWCWFMSPFVVNEETQILVIDNITYLLNSFIYCSEYENIVFSWMMYDMSIIESIVSRLNLNLCKFHLFTLVNSNDTLTQIPNSTNPNGIGKEKILDQSLLRRQLNNNITTRKIDLSNINVSEAANLIKEQLKTHETSTSHRTTLN